MDAGRNYTFHARLPDDRPGGRPPGDAQKSLNFLGNSAFSDSAGAFTIREAARGFGKPFEN
jgi:hypothetical protein